MLTVRILQPKYVFFFVWMLVIPGAIAYFGGWDTTLNYLFFLKAFAIAIFATVAYYLIEKQLAETKNRR